MDKNKLWDKIVEKTIKRLTNEEYHRLSDESIDFQFLNSIYDKAIRSALAEQLKQVLSKIDKFKIDEVELITQHGRSADVEEIVEFVKDKLKKDLKGDKNSKEKT